METKENKAIAIYSLTMMENGSIRINSDWGDITNSQLNLFINSVINPSDKILEEAKKKIINAASTKGQSQIVDSFLAKGDKKRNYKKSNLYKPSELVRYHYFQSYGKLSGGDNE